MPEQDKETAEPPKGRPAAQSGETFKREGPEPPERDSGSTVEEMNRDAADALLRNIRPDPKAD